MKKHMKSYFHTYQYNYLKAKKGIEKAFKIAL
jgi:hypothetical protein